MPTEEILLDVDDRMEKAIAKLKRDLSGIRTGRANPGLVDSITINAYGADVALNQVATVACPEPNQIVIRPFDVGTLKDIERGIINSGIGYAPNNDGRIIRLNIPPLSTEVRRKMVSQIKEMSEQAKIAIRNVRRDGNRLIDLAEKDKQISEDERDSAKEEIQEYTKKYEKTANELSERREKDVMDD